MNVFIFVNADTGDVYAYKSLERFKADFSEYRLNGQNRQGDLLVEKSSGGYVGYIQERTVRE